MCLGQIFYAPDGLLVECVSWRGCRPAAEDRIMEGAIKEVIAKLKDDPAHAALVARLAESVALDIPCVVCGKRFLEERLHPEPDDQGARICKNCEALTTFG